MTAQFGDGYRIIVAFLLLACAASLEPGQLRTLLVALAIAELLVPARGATLVAVEGTLVAFALLWLAPGVLGESNALPGLIAAGLAALLATGRRRRAQLARGRRSLTAAGCLLALYWVAVLITGRNYVGNEDVLLGYTVLLIPVAVWLHGSPGAVRGIRLYGFSVSILVWFWVISRLAAALGATGDPVVLAGDDVGREGFVYQHSWPITIETIDRSGGVGSRLVAICGEPGLMALSCMLAFLALIVTRRTSEITLGSATALIGLLLGIVATNSTAAIISVPLGWLIWWVVRSGEQPRDAGRARVRIRLARAALLAGAGPAIWIGIQFAISQKAGVNPLSLSDRGISLGSAAASDFGNGSRISLLATAASDGLAVVLVLAAIAVIVWAFRHGRTEMSAVAAICILAGASQPMVYLLGMWLCLFLCLPFRVEPWYPRPRNTSPSRLGVTHGR